MQLLIKTLNDLSRTIKISQLSKFTNKNLRRYFKKLKFI